jgi:RimJ/RimL family protein N-acetyltransferase
LVARPGDKVKPVRTLTTPRLDLVALAPERDLEDLHEMFGDPDWAARAVYEEPSPDLAATRARLDREFGDNGGWTWVVRLRPSTRAIGVLGIFSDQGTSIRGLSWYLRRDHWGQGIMSEAARVVVDHLLTQPGITGVEAWIDSRNSRSIGVARGARLAHSGRLPRVYDTETAQSVVMARAAEPRDPATLAVRPSLPVRDVARTARLLVDVLGMHVRFELPELIRLGLTPWSDGAGIDVKRQDGAIAAISITLDLGVAVGPVHETLLAAGCEVTAPADTPWYRREFTLRLTEGHLLTLSGPLRPPGR